MRAVDAMIYISSNKKNKMLLIECKVFQSHNTYTCVAFIRDYNTSSCILNRISPSETYYRESK